MAEEYSLNKSSRLYWRHKGRHGSSCPQRPARHGRMVERRWAAGASGTLARDRLLQCVLLRKSKRLSGRNRVGKKIGVAAHDVRRPRIRAGSAGSTQPASEQFQALEPSGPLPPRPRRMERAGAAEAGPADTAAAAGAAALFLAPPSEWEYDGRADRAPVPPLPPLPALSPVPAPAVVLTAWWTPGMKEGALPTKPRSEEASAAFSEEASAACSLKD